ncbi:MAG: hypothetical protein JXR97_08480, partial [Planctomycetes bacterium]|nr:hypothetical protein [Planctomycetota bacterium]
GKAKAEEENQEPDTLEALMDHQRFAYISGGRDPFTFRNKTEEESAGGAGVTKAGAGDVTSKLKDMIKKEDRVNYLAGVIEIMEIQILDHQYAKAIEAGDAAKKKMAAVWGGERMMDTDPDVNDLYRKMLSYERTAKRLQQALDIKKEFEGLNIELKGLRWTPSGSAVVINGEIYEPGGIVRFKDAGATPVQIEVIEEDAVVFIYKGQRFRKVVGEAPVESGKLPIGR